MNKNKCPRCKSAMKPWEGEVSMYGVTVVAMAHECGECGERTFTAEQSKELEQRVAKALVDAGARTGPAFKFLRKAAGLKAAELADILGVTPETVSRWEREKVAIPRAIAFTLGELHEHPQRARRRLVPA
jgi:putative zinc finger/helix-turn-helix YgiT family protein